MINFLFFFFNDTATTEIYTLSLHDALPISDPDRSARRTARRPAATARRPGIGRSEEHTSELQSHLNLVCRLLLEKKKTRKVQIIYHPPRVAHFTVSRAGDCTHAAAPSSVYR